MYVTQSSVAERLVWISESCGVTIRGRGMGGWRLSKAQYACLVMCVGVTIWGRGGGRGLLVTKSSMCVFGDVIRLISVAGRRVCMSGGVGVTERSRVKVVSTVLHVFFLLWGCDE